MFLVSSGTSKPGRHASSSGPELEDLSPDANPDGTAAFEPVGPQTAPTEPVEFWEESEQYEPTDERPRNAAWALSVFLGAVLVIVAGVAYMVGTSRADRAPEVTRTVTATPEPGPTVTVKSQLRVTSKPKVSIKPGPTVYRLQPGPTTTRWVTKTPEPKVRVSIRPGPTKTVRECFERDPLDDTLSPVECP